MVTSSTLSVGVDHLSCSGMVCRPKRLAQLLVRRFVNLWLLAMSLVPCLTLASEACDSTDSVGFICGIENAEDLVRVPNSGWVIASGR